MAGWRQVVELAMSEEEIGEADDYFALADGAGEPGGAGANAAGATARIPSFFAVGKRLGTHHQVVQRCVERAVAYGPLTATR